MKTLLCAGTWEPVAPVLHNPDTERAAINNRIKEVFAANRDVAKAADRRQVFLIRKYLGQEECDVRNK